MNKLVDCKLQAFKYENNFRIPNEKKMKLCYVLGVVPSDKNRV